MTILVITSGGSALVVTTAPYPQYTAKKGKMMYQCHNCDAIFHETDQTECQRKHGQCPYCHSDDVTEVGTYD